VWQSGVQAAATNCIVFDNTASSDAQISSGTGGFGYSCSTDLTTDNHNITDNPNFRRIGSGYGIGYVAGNYRLAQSSPCRNTGLNDASWMTGGVDLDGNPRIYPPGGTVDMGCYEIGAPKGTVFMAR
jgi:hypothetical protein